MGLSASCHPAEHGTSEPSGGRPLSCGVRHWFTYFGWVGSSSPTCVRCGVPNPKYRLGDDPYAGEGPTGVAALSAAILGGLDAPE